MASNPQNTQPTQPTQPTETTRYTSLGVYPATLARLHSIRDKLWLSWGTQVTMDEVINELADRYEEMHDTSNCPKQKAG